MSDNLLAARALDAMVDAVVAADRDGQVRLWNLGAERLFGWSAKSVVGGPFPGIPDEQAQQERDAALAKVMAGEDVSLATTQRRADGSLVDVWIVFSPMRAWLDGPIDGWLAVIRDATQERAVQRALRRRVELVGRLASVIASLNSDLDLPTVLQRISESGRELLAADGAAYVMLDGDDLVIAAVSGLDSQLVGERIPLVESAVATLLESGRTSMALNNDDYPNYVDARRGHEFAAAAVGDRAHPSRRAAVRSAVRVLRCAEPRVGQSRARRARTPRRGGRRRSCERARL